MAYLNTNLKFYTNFSIKKKQNKKKRKSSTVYFRKEKKDLFLFSFNLAPNFEWK